MSMLLESEKSLKEDLRNTLEGEVRFDKGDLSLYATDASNYRYIPIGVVIPKNRSDVIKTVNICRKHNIPIVSRGGGTGLAGQTTNAAVVMDMSKYFHRTLEINTEEKWARVEPGIVLDHLNREVSKHGLIVGPDPATHSHCTIGGMIGNNSCGAHAQWAGKMEENTLELEVMTYRGEIFKVGMTDKEELKDILLKKDGKAKLYREVLALKERYAEDIRSAYPQIPRRVSGYNLDELLCEPFNMAKVLVGSESSIITILEAKIKLLENPQVRGMIVIGYPDIVTAGYDVPNILPLKPMAFEAIDNFLREHIEEKHIHPEGLKLLPEGHSWLFLEFGAKDESELKNLLQEKLQKLKDQSKKDDSFFKFSTDKDEQEKLWKVRESGLGATARNPNGKSAWPGWEDAAIPPEKVGEYLSDYQKLTKKYGYHGALYGHFGQGCIHTRIDFDLVTHEGIEKYHSFIREGAVLVKKYKGSLSGEHGDGQARAELLETMFGKKVMQAMAEFKEIWDPDNMMNPGKIIHPNSATDHLRLGEHHERINAQTHFSYYQDQNSFAFATQRCVGVGECRKLEGGTMCPSFKVTFEEKHSTRGRAHLLFEMMKKDTLIKTWKSEEVKESLDLCLACKGCKSDCPVSVDVATYKAEFLSHYYKGRLRPRAAYSMGLIMFWNRIAKFVPGLVNFVTHTKPFSVLMKKAGGIAPQREFPYYAKQTFRKIMTAKSKAKTTESKGRVLVWVDSFNNYFHPQVLSSLSETLETLGFEVALPQKNLCCGRPLYDYGMLDLAKSFLKKVLTKLHDDIEIGTPVIFAEPSCMAVFQDELVNLFPNDLDARRLSQQCYTLSQFLDHKNIKLPAHKLKDADLVYHGHCHQKSLNSLSSEEKILSQFSSASILNTGCCGMAGSFGFEEGERYEVSKKVAESDILKKLDDHSGACVVADGFSCREQIKQTKGFYPLHSAEVIAKNLRGEAWT